MKVAVSYSGGLRTFKKCYRQNHDVLSQLGDLDYFISIWDTPCYTKVARFDDVLAINGDTIYDDLLRPDEIITEDYLRSFLPFKGIDLEPLSRMEEIIGQFKDLPWHIMHPSRLVSQYYKTNRAFELVPEGYDLHVRIRPDVIIHNLPIIDPAKIYMNYMVYVNSPALEGETVNEMLYICNEENMRSISKIYGNFPLLWNKDDAFGERMSYKNFKHENLLDKIELFDFDLRVIRENGNNEFIR